MRYTRNSLPHTWFPGLPPIPYQQCPRLEVRQRPQLGCLGTCQVNAHWLRHKSHQSHFSGESPGQILIHVTKQKKRREKKHTPISCPPKIGFVKLIPLDQNATFDEEKLSFFCISKLNFCKKEFSQNLKNSLNFQFATFCELHMGRKKE